MSKKKIFDTTEEENNFEVSEEDDVEVESFEEMENPAKKIKTLREKLKTCEKEKVEFLTGWQRARADVANARNEQERTRKNFAQQAKQDVLSSLLPVVDSFQMAFSDKDAWEKVDKNWRVGVEYIYSQLNSTLAEHGLEAYDPEGEEFDPKRHESIELVPTDDESKDGVVMEVIQKGYMLSDQVIRPAKVKVGQVG